MGQIWLCDGCGKRGEVEIPPRTDAISGAYSIGDDHALASPDCAIDLSGLRILVERNCAPGEKERILAGYRPASNH